LLQQRGHTVVTPILSGLGADQDRLSADTTLSQHVKDVCNAVSGSADVTLVGHSYAGMIVSGVAEAHPEKVQRLVFADAFIPEDRQCVLDLLPSDIGVHFRKVAQNQGSGWRLPGGEDLLDLWGLVPGEEREFVRARLCDFSLRCFEEPILLQANRKASIPGTYISCVAQNYPARPFFEVFADKARACGWDVAKLNTGHDCHVERPSEVAQILLAGTH